MLHEMATGRPAFTGKGRASLIAAIMEREPVPVSTLAPASPPALDHVVTRCLAKDPEARWQTARDVLHELEWIRSGSSGAGDASSATAPGARASAVAPPVRTGRTPWGSLAIAVVVVTAIASAWMFRAPLQRLLHPLAKPVRKQWILVADFEGPAADPGLATAAREVVRSLLDQSSVVVTLPPDQVRAALQFAGKPDSTRVSATVARELAFRNAIRSVVEGRIDRLGASYPVTLRVRDVERDSLLFTVNGTAMTEADLVSTLDRLARGLQRTLGDHVDAISATRMAIMGVSTPSFEAFRKYQQATERNGVGDYAGAILLARDAIAIDPGFARAYYLKGILFMNLGRPDSATVAFQAALKRKDRLTELTRLALESSLAKLDGDNERALALCDQMLRGGAVASNVWNMRSVILGNLGRFDEQVESCRQSITTRPVAPSQLLLSNLAYALITTGHFTEAEVMLPKLKGKAQPEVSLALAWAEGRWSRADSLARVLSDDPATDVSVRSAALGMRACESIARGELASADQQARASRDAWRRIDPAALDFSMWNTMLFAWTMGASMPDLRVDIPAETRAEVLQNHIGIAATLGDTVRARRLLERYLRRPRTELRQMGATTKLLEAMIASRMGRWDAVVRALGPVAPAPMEYGSSQYGTGRAWPRFLLANAYEKLNRSDSAAVYFEGVLPSRTPPYGVDTGARRALSSFAHYRLVALYARMGRRADAERHLRELETTLTRPDPSLRHWIPDARAAVAAMPQVPVANR
jgi:Flp pilus assembly protein TadD